MAGLESGVVGKESIKVRHFIKMEEVITIHGLSQGHKQRLQMTPGKRPNISSLNAHLVCVICSGYYVEATTVVECLHTFCRSCIINYLKTCRFCPICDVQINHSKPWSSLRADKTVQDLVYKLVPGLYQDEMRRRREFYSRLGMDASCLGEGEDRGFMPQGPRFLSQDDSIFLSLEYYSGQGETDAEKDAKRVNGQPKRYLHCPAAVTVRHLKKFLQMKYGIGAESWVEIIYSDECLPEDFSLIDVAYTFNWRITSPMRLSYRIFTKTVVKPSQAEDSSQTASVKESASESVAQQISSLEQQKQNEYLGIFNLNPKKSEFSKIDDKHFSDAVTDGSVDDANSKALREDANIDDCSREKTFPFSEDSNVSGLRIISEKEESLKGHSEDLQGSAELDKKKKYETPMPSFGEEAEDGFATKKLLRNKHKSDGRKERKKHDGEKRRRSASHAEAVEDGTRKNSLDGKRRRKSMMDSLSEENLLRFEIHDKADEEEVEPLANLKNEALRKVFVMKEKSEVGIKGKEEEVRRKKRKKSKHHEGETKRRKTELVPASPSILSFAKDPLKLKVKLTPIMKPSEDEVESKPSKKESSEWESEKEARAEMEKSNGDEGGKKITSDKERLLHLRAVRHKNIIKTNSQEYISAPRSLTISKVDANDQQQTKPRIVENRPSLEIVLIPPPSDASKTKKPETSPMFEKKPDSKKEMTDTFGVLDLSEKSTRTKESVSIPPKEATENVEKSKKSAQQSILQIAQTLVNRKLSPLLPDKRFEAVSDPTTAAAAMRNLKTLSDTAVNILMAAQGKGFSASPESPKRAYPTTSTSPSQQKTISHPKTTKDCENASGLKIPIYPVARERTNPIPPIPNLHEIYPKGRGRPATSLSRMSPITVKPGQNQTVRQIPNPSALLNRQNHQVPNRLPVPQQKFPENGDHAAPQKPNSKLNSIPPLQSIKSKMILAGADEGSDKMLVPKIMNNNSVKNVHNGSDNGYNSVGAKNGDDAKKTNAKMTNNSNSIRRIESMARNIESVAAGLTARAVSNAMVDAK